MKVKILLASVLFIFCLKTFNGLAQGINKQDSLALIDLYNSTNGPGWTTHTNWLTTAPVNSWSGIITDSGRVIYLTLDYNRLVGVIPTSLGNLNHLYSLNLANNQLSGSIPSTLANIWPSPNIVLSNNQLSGSIPSSFNNLPFNSSIYLDNNKLNFTGFEDIKSKYNLYYKKEADIPLTRNGNLLSVSAGGTLSNNTYKWYKDTVLISTKKGDSTFTISSPGNYSVAVTNALAPQLTLYSISAISVQDSLALLDLYNNTKGAGWTNNINWLTTAPAATWNGVTVRFGRVEEILLDSNNLSGSLSTSIGNLSNLKTLLLNDNTISGSIPSSFGSCSFLTYLGLAGNEFTGSIPSSFGDLTLLQTLSLNGNQLNGTIPSSLSNLSSLFDLDLSQNQLRGTIPSSFESLSKLQYLLLSGNQLTGSIPSSLGNLANIYTLDASNNKLTGDIPSSFGKNSPLANLIIFNNQLTGVIPDSISYLTKLNRIDLHNNQLTGSIPDSLGKASDLFDLYLNNNKLSGNVPSALSKLRFSDYNVASNYFTFSGMESLPKANSLVYAPQYNIPLSKNGNMLSVSAGGTLANDTFKLYKDGVLQATHVGDSTFVLPGEGKISISVTNAIAKELTLYSDTISIGLKLANATTTVTENITGYASAEVNNGTVKLLNLAPAQGSNSLTGTVTSTVTIDTAVSTYKSQPYVQRHYDITPSTNADKAQATITLYFTQQDFDNYNSYLVTHSLANPTLPTGGVDNGNIRVIQFHGTFTGSSNPANYGDSTSVVITPVVVWDAADNWWAVTFPVSGFSGFYVSTGGFTLPLTLLQFWGTSEKTSVHLQWLTTNEINTKQFVIERGNNTSSFNSIGSVAAISASGNNQYNFYDEQPLSGNNFYRLKMMDKDGKFMYSPVVIVKRTGAAPALSVYPNPSNNNTTLLFNQTIAQEFVIEIRDISGKLLKRINGVSASGTNKVNINMHEYAKGTYILTLSNKETGKQTISFSKQ